MNSEEFLCCLCADMIAEGACAGGPNVATVFIACTHDGTVYPRYQGHALISYGTDLIYSSMEEARNGLICQQVLLE
jgi:hypothetical protein